MDAPPSVGSVGSSPRSWGTRLCVPAARRPPRFIPTLVGNTERICRGLMRIAVHPHARGEHAVLAANNIYLIGSSPRSWGTRYEHLERGLKKRFIPTLVGNTGISARICARPSVHPHARGEHSAAAARTERDSGSSPRSWGTPRPHPSKRKLSRFIPTLVGNTDSSVAKAAPYPVHPHARGEHIWSVKSWCTDCGSSPRSWGTPVVAVGNLLVRRFIPTLVGNTGPASMPTALIAVHPHARGEHFHRESMQYVGGGSSPRSWGTRMRMRWPAC